MNLPVGHDVMWYSRHNGHTDVIKLLDRGFCVQLDSKPISLSRFPRFLHNLTSDIFLEALFVCLFVCLID